MITYARTNGLVDMPARSPRAVILHLRRARRAVAVTGTCGWCKRQAWRFEPDGVRSAHALAGYRRRLLRAMRQWATKHDHDIP